MSKIDLLGTLPMSERAEN